MRSNLTSITLSDLRQGIESLEPSHPKRQGLLAKLEILEQQFEGRVLSFDAAAARLWGRLKGWHGWQGRVLPDIDFKSPPLPCATA
jgi:predicted nucleic acid-binding protein